MYTDWPTYLQHTSSIIAMYSHLILLATLPWLRVRYPAHYLRIINEGTLLPCSPYDPPPSLYHSYLPVTSVTSQLFILTCRPRLG